MLSLQEILATAMAQNEGFATDTSISYGEAVTSVSYDHGKSAGNTSNGYGIRQRFYRK
jgi:hypothetical protein